MSSEQVDLTKATNDVELLAMAPEYIGKKTATFFSRYQQFFYGFLTGAAVVCASKMARKSMFSS